MTTVNGKLIAKMRKEKGFSQTELAIKAKIGQSYVSKIETNIYEPSIKTLARIAKVLGADYKEFLI